MEADRPFDVVIVGSGIGGLSLGIVLSLSRLRVAVIEKNTLPGGLMRSYQRDGQDCPVGIHYFGAFGEGEPLRRMCDYLGVADRMQVERMGRKGPIDRYLFDDFSFDLPEGLDAFAASLEEACPGERQAIAAILKNLRALAEVQNAFTFLSASPPALDMELFAPLRQYLTHRHCSARLKSILGVASRWMGMSEAECPVLYHHLALVSYLTSSWRLSGNGSDLAEAFSTRFRELGGVLLCGDPVVTILASGEGVAGVKLASGRVLDAARIAAAIHPKSVLPMLPAGAVKPRYARRIMELEDTEGLFAVHVALEAGTQAALPHNLYRLHADPEGMLEAGVFYQLRRGRGGKNLLMIITKSAYAEWAPWEDTTTGKRGAAYGDEKARRAEGLLRGAEVIFGSLNGAKVLDAYTPLTVRDWVQSPQGTPYGVMRSSRQMHAATLLHRVSLKGLFFAGQNTLSPGVLGTLLGSFQTARQMIGHDHFSREIYEKLVPGR